MFRILNLFFYRVDALAWNADDDVLYIGGRFSRIDNRELSNGLASWTEEDGVHSFEGGGLVSKSSGPRSVVEVKSLAYVSAMKVTINML